MLPALFAIATGVSIYGQIKAGQAAARTARQQAKQMQIDRIMGEAEAAESMALRYDSYNDAMSESNAMFLGGMEAAQQAFAESSKKILVSDIATMSRMKTLRSGQASIASAIEIQRGINAKRASLYQAIGTIGQAAYQYQTFK